MSNQDDAVEAREIINAAGIAAVDVRDGDKASIDHTTVSPPETDGNWGIYATPDDATVLIDIDDYGDDDDDDVERGLTAVRGLPETFQQTSPHGGEHRVYRVETDDRPVAEHLEDALGAANPKPSWGEVRVANQYVVGAGSTLASCGKDWHDCSADGEGRYEVAEAREVATIDVTQLIGALVRDEALSPSSTDESDESGQTRQSDTDIDLRVSEVVTGCERGERTSHPIHGSSTGSNFLIDEDDETWRCWRHDVTGSALHLVGMQAGVLECGEWSSSSITTEQWADVFEAARERGLIDETPAPGAIDLEELADEAREQMDDDRDDPLGILNDDGEVTDDADTDADTSGPLEDPLTESEWVDYATRDDIDTVLVQVPNPDYDPDEDDPSDKHEVDYRSGRALERSGLGDDETVTAAITRSGTLVDESTVRVEVRLTAEETVGKRLKRRDRGYIADDEAAQLFITRSAAAFGANTDLEVSRERVANLIDDAVEVLHIPETDATWVFHADSGAWEPQGGAVIKSVCASVLGAEWTSATRREVLMKVRDRNSESVDTAWDARPGVPNDVLPVANGLLKLPTYKTDRAGDGPELIDNTPDARVRNSIPVEYDPDANTDIFRAFLQEITPDDGTGEAYADTLEEVVGQILLPDNRNPMLPILCGGGGNGKGVLERVITEFTGASMSSVEIEKLEDNPFSWNTVEGNMVNFVADTDAKRLASVNSVKKLTGNDRIEIEPKGSDSYHRRLRASLIIGANRAPMFPESNDAIARRILPIPMPHRFTRDPDPDDPNEKQRVRHREDEITSDEGLSAVLACALEGLERYEVEEEFSHPLTEEERLSQYRRQSDTILAAAEDLLVEESGQKVPKAAVYDAYASYARDRGESPAASSVFWRRAGKTDLPSREGRPTAPDGDGRERVVHGIAVTAEAYRQMSEEWRSHEWVVDGVQASGQWDDALGIVSDADDPDSLTNTDGSEPQTATDGGSADDNPKGESAETVKDDTDSAVETDKPRADVDAGERERLEDDIRTAVDAHAEPSMGAIASKCATDAAARGDEAPPEKVRAVVDAMLEDGTLIDAGDHIEGSW